VIAQLDSVALEYQGVAQPIDIEFTDPGIIASHPYQILDGRWMVDGPVGLSAQVVINQRAASNLGVGVADVVQIRVPGVTSASPAVVVGIVDDGGLNAAAYGALSDVAAFLTSNARHLVVSIEVTDPSLTLADLERRLASLASMAVDTESWQVQQTDTVGDQQREVEATRTAFMVVGILGLIAGIVAMANVGLSALKERSAEMTLRRTLGARRWHLPALLIIEAQIVAVAASVPALALSLIVFPVITTTFGAPFGVTAPPFPWVLAALGLLVGMATALIGAIVPAVHSLNTPLGTVVRGG
jgi:ABC-type antimicrobial peptide transport system permease subunit